MGFRVVVVLAMLMLFGCGLWSKDTMFGRCNSANRFLDSSDFIEAVVAHVARTSWVYSTTNAMGERVMKDAPWPYASPGDYVEKNPDCCSIYTGPVVEFYTALSWPDRFFGWRSEVVKVSYPQPVMSGKLLSSVKKDRYVVVNACGDVHRY